MALKDEIRSRRRTLGMAQYDLAAALKVCPSTVHKWETGKSKPNFKKIFAMTKVFGISEQELLNSISKDENEKN